MLYLVPSDVLQRDVHRDVHRVHGAPTVHINPRAGQTDSGLEGSRTSPALSKGLVTNFVLNSL